MASSEREPESRSEDRGGERADPLTAAIRRARRRIDEDRRRYPEDLKPVFEVLAARLFELGFDAKAAAPNRAARQRFRFEVSVTLRAYRDRQRLVTAIELVGGSELPIAEIAEALGFGDLVLFRKWFKWRTGQAPQTLRRVRRDGPTAASPAAPTAEPPPPVDRPWTIREFRLAAAGGVSRERGAALIRLIRELYPNAAKQRTTD